MIKSGQRGTDELSFLLKKNESIITGLTDIGIIRKISERP